MKQVTITRVANGWIIAYTPSYVNRKEVYTTQEEMLLAVLHSVGDWLVGDTVEIHHHE